MPNTHNVVSKKTPPAFFAIGQRNGVRNVRSCSDELIDTVKPALLNRQFDVKEWKWLATYYKTADGVIENYPVPLLYKTHAERVLNAHIRHLAIPTRTDVARMKKRVEDAVGAKIDWSRNYYTGAHTPPTENDVFSLFTRLSRTIDDRDRTEGEAKVQLRIDALELMQRIMTISNYDGEILTERDLY